MEQIDYEIDLSEIFYILKKRWLLIAGVTVLSIVIAALITIFLMKPVYETSTTLLVSHKQSTESVLNYNDIMASQKLVNTYSEIIKSRTIAEKVIRNLNLDINPNDLSNMITVSPVKDTEIIKITVKNTSEFLATSIANEIATVFKSHITSMMKIDSISTVDIARVPTEPVGPRLTLNVAIAGILGLMVSVGIVFLLYFLDKTLKTTYDVEKYLGLPIIGAIPDLEAKVTQNKYAQSRFAKKLEVR